MRTNNGGVPREAGAPASREPGGAVRLRAFLGHLPRLCGGLSIVVGSVALAAWWLGLAHLTSLLAGLPRMMASTAVMAVLAGMSLILLAPITASRGRLVIGALCAGVVGSIAGMTIAEYALGLDFSVDQFLATEAFPLLPYPGRSSPQTATAFAAIAAALLTIDYKTSRGLRPAEILALFAALVSVIALLGHLFRIAAFYGPATLPPSTGMSVPTVLAVLALSVGIMSARIDAGVLSILVEPDNGGLAARQLMAWLVVFAPVVCAVALGVRVGALSAESATPIVVLIAAVGGGGLVLRVSRRLSQLDRVRKRLEQEQTFLAEAGTILSSSLEYEQTLTSIAQLAVRDLADLCVVDLVEEGEIRRLKAVSRDPSKRWLCDLLMRVRVDRADPHLIWRILETGGPVLMETLPPETIEAFSRIDEYRRLLEAMPVRSILAVPLLTRGSPLGAIVLVRSSDSRPYERSDLGVAQALAERAALSIENARHYRTARRAIEARDNLLGIVAHDLRNPLGAILMHAAMLRRGDDETDRRSRKPAESIERAATRMNRLIQDLLDVTTIEAGGLSVEFGHVPADQLVSDSVDAQKSLASAASLALQLEIEPGLPELRGDRERLLQVFENLIGNAVKFTEPGGRITVGAMRRDAEVLFRVSDTGVGVEAENLSHLFDRFWQKRTARRRGAGLGLPIVKGIVEAHGGRIWVESAPGRGSTFFFTIPVASGAGLRPAPVALAAGTSR